MRFVVISCYPQGEREEIVQELLVERMGEEKAGELSNEVERRLLDDEAG